VGETAAFRIALRKLAVDKPVDGRRLYCAARSPRFGGFSIFRPSFFPHEAHLSAERSPPEAQARLPGSHVDPGRPRDPQAPPREGPRAPLRVSCERMKRANRLSRSRDFDAVYRHGRSVSSRFLVLYWFPQEEPTAPRFGFSVPRSVGGAVERNKIKRQLREVWQARLERVPEGNDYVLIVRPGLPDAVAANGFEWLGARVDEVLAQTKAAA
jgi:ribonuclease P protein component